MVRLMMTIVNFHCALGSVEIIINEYVLLRFYFKPAE